MSSSAGHDGRGRSPSRNQPLPGGQRQTVERPGRQPVESGDQQRFYLPTHRPEYEWPADAPRTFFYLDRDLAVTFVSGKAVSFAPIDAEVREQVLLPLVRRHGGAG
jgi:hypothetical protein